MEKSPIELRREHRIRDDRKLFSMPPFSVGALVTFLLYSPNVSIWIGAVVFCFVILIGFRLIFYMGDNLGRTALRFLISFTLGALLAALVAYFKLYIYPLL